MRFIDTHCHYNDPAYAEDAGVCIERAVGAGVGIMIQADIDSSERDSMLSLVDRYPDVLRPMLGLYPCSAREDWREELEKMEARHRELEAGSRREIKEGRELEAGRQQGIEAGRKRRKGVAIGEIGLDYHEGRENEREQKEALNWQLEYSVKHSLPVNIHLRDAMEDLLDILRAHRQLGLRGSLHAYSGSYESFCELQRLGDWYIGVGGVVTFKKARLADVVRRVPLDRIVLETDAPYLTPMPYRGTRNESSYIPLIAAKIAELKGICVEEVAEVTTANAVRLFGLDANEEV